MLGQDDEIVSPDDGLRAMVVTAKHATEMADEDDAAQQAGKSRIVGVTPPQRCSDRATRLG